MVVRPSNRRQRGFTLLEVLLVLLVLSALLTLLFLYIPPLRQRAADVSAQAYVRNVALGLEASREFTGSLGLNVTDCTQGFGDKPPSILSCTITYTGLEYRIEATIQGGKHSRVVYDSQTGDLAALP